MNRKTIAGRQCFVHEEGKPEVLLIQPVDDHDIEVIESEIAHISRLAGGRGFTLAAFKVDDWNRDLSPWEAPPVFGDEGFGSGADDTLKYVMEKLLPELDAGSFRRVFIGGYSLAGFFSLWAAYQTDAFDGAAAASPSVWFPGWMGYAGERSVKAEHVYLSLGNKEEKTRNPVMRTVGDNIRSQLDILKKDPGCTDCILEMNEGNHFREPDLRTAKGFAWLISKAGSESNEKKSNRVMGEKFDIQEYLSEGVEQIVKDALKATFRDPAESAFLGKFAIASAKATRKRKREEAEGLHVPSYLIASITSSCNLHCAGCYSRSNHATVDCKPTEQLTDEEWLRIFREAQELGISFILLAGGEPMLRRDIIEAAGRMQDIIFPIFTNGTFMNDRYFELFDKYRNLIPVMSIEGDREETDSRRGQGVYDLLIENMDKLHDKGLIYGASITVTKENIGKVLSDDFLDTLESRGCKAVFYIEYVPVTDESKDLAPDDEDREFIRTSIERLRSERQSMIYVSFPGDEKSSGGCLAAGRGFFHINSHGGAEPCPFSAYSDINVRDTSLKEAMDSGLFRALRDGDVLKEDHAGGCVLFEKRDQVEAIMAKLAQH